MDKVIDNNKIRILYWNKKLTIKEIAKFFGVSYTCIRLRMISFGIPRRESWYSGNNLIRLPMNGENHPRWSKKKLKCSFCGKEIFVIKYKRLHEKNHFCNMECYANWMEIHLKGKNNPFYGKHHTKISKDKNKIAHLRENLSREIIEKLRKARMKQKIPLKDTLIEKALQKELKKRKITFRTHIPILNITQPDIFIEPNICVYADGTYWHKKYNYKNDRKINRKLKKNGFMVFRFSEDKIYEDVESCIDSIVNKMWV
jgi:very-short-patch-repair endonuclease